MFEQEYALLKLFEKANRIEGRKKLQKTVHLLQMAGVPFGMDFKYHYYGPYSAELQSYIDVLVDYGMLREDNQGDTYIYEMTDKGKEFMQKYRETVGNDFSLPTESVERVLSYPATTLELTSTIGYLISLGYTMDVAKSKALELKPHLKNYLDKAEALYNSMM
jgi:uncharacterized protein YwgA